MMRYILLCTIVWGVAVNAFAFDTTFVGNGTVGPYRLSDRIINESSIRIILSDSMYTPEYLFDPLTNNVIFSSPIDSLQKVSVSYAIGFPSLTRTHFRYRPEAVDSISKIRFMEDTTQKEKPVFASENLLVSGYKSIGIAVGNAGQSNLTQALDVSISGEIGPKTLLEAHLSDQGSSLYGATKEVAELDRIYVTLTHPKFGITAGDQIIYWPQLNFLSGQKNIKGLSLVGKSTIGNGTVFGAISAGNATVTTFLGRAGLQGPYFLRGNSGENVTIIAGTVVVSKNGKKLTEGELEDFRIDYEQGFISFNTRIHVAEKDFFRVSYEYTTTHYRRLLAGTNLSSATVDSSVVVVGALWYESDDKNHPLDLEISPADRESLSVYGSNPWLKEQGVALRGIRADSAASLAALYSKKDSLGAAIFIYRSPLVRFALDSTYYQVVFRNVGIKKGEYSLLRKECPFPISGICYDIFEYRGEGLGEYTAKAAFPTPGRTVNGEIRLMAKPHPKIALTLDVAGQERNSNLFSNTTSVENLASAASANVTAGNRLSIDKGVWAGVEGSALSSQFTRYSQSISNDRNGWDDTTVLGPKGTMAGVNSFSGFSLGPNFQTEIDGGRLYQNSSVATDRLFLHCSLVPIDSINIAADLKGFWHKLDLVPSKMYTSQIQLKYAQKYLTTQGYVGNQWRISENNGAGNVSGKADLFFMRLGLLESVFAQVNGRGTSSYGNLIDTGYSGVWEQRVNRTLVPGWNTTLTSSYALDKQSLVREVQPTFLAALTSDVTLNRIGFSSKQEYGITFERASVFVQEARYVGAGFGNYVRDTLQSSASYVPKENGSYAITNKEWFDTSAVPDRVRKTNALVSYSLSLPDSLALKGLLSDLTFKGSFSVLEQLSDSLQTGVSYIPGYISLAQDSSSTIRYSSVSYRQEILFEPAALTRLSASIMVRPFLQILPLYKENGFEGLISGSYEQRVITHGIQFRNYMLTHAKRTLYGSNFKAQDFSGMVSQRVPLRTYLETSLKTTVGYAKQSATKGDQNAGFYTLIEPELVLRPNATSMITVGYTAAWVNARNLTDFRLAKGYAYGTTHALSVYANVSVSKRIELSGTYRGEISPKSALGYTTSGSHVVSLEVKAYF